MSIIKQPIPIDAIEKKQRQWRDLELKRTDILVLLPDYPDVESLLNYRQSLRDWPTTEDFPYTRPIL